jgi:hypothetical protein
MNTTVTQRMMKGLVLGAGLVLSAGAGRARADRVRVAAVLPGVALDFGPHHAAIALGDRSNCNIAPQRIWHEPVYEWRQVWVDVPAVVEQRRVAQYSACGTLIGYRYVEVVVSPARRELRTERVLVRDGYYETVYEPCRDGCDGVLGVRVGSGDGHVVIDRRPAVTHVRRVAPGPDVVRGIRPHRAGVRVRIGR